MLSRADVTDNMKRILGLILALIETIQERTICCQFQGVLIPALSLSPSLFLLSCFLPPSVFLSLLPVLTCLPSFLPYVVTSSSGDALRPNRLLRIFMFVRSRTNLHTCKLPLAGSRSSIVKYARGSHISFAFQLYKPDTFVHASNAQVRCVHYLHNTF